MNLIVTGNSKLGPGTHVFSIPAKRTCPGKTAACSSVCYAANGHYRTKFVKSSLDRRFEISKRPDFDHLVVAEIVRRGLKLVRVHAAGDLYSPTYAKAWVRIMKRCPDTTFWIYTRSWRLPKFRPVLRAMAALPNAHVWFSADVDSGIPKVPKNVRVAWLMVGTDDAPPRPVDLVFRTKKVKKALVAAVVETGPGRTSKVCPTETGLPGSQNVTCASCKRCFTADAPTGQAAPRRTALPVLV